MRGPVGGTVPAVRPSRGMASRAGSGTTDTAHHRSPPSLSDRQRVRMRWYLMMMCMCLALIVSAWTVVRLVLVWLRSRCRRWQRLSRPWWRWWPSIMMAVRHDGGDRKSASVDITEVIRPSIIGSESRSRSPTRSRATTPTHWRPRDALDDVPRGARRGGAAVLDRGFADGYGSDGTFTMDVRRSDTTMTGSIAIYNSGCVSGGQLTATVSCGGRCPRAWSRPSRLRTPTPGPRSRAA